MLITSAWLKKNNTCVKDVEYYHSLHETDALKILERLLADKKLTFANWTIAHLLNKENQHNYAFFAVLQVFPLWEKKFPEIAAIWRKWVDGDCPEALRKATEAVARDVARAVAQDTAWVAAGVMAGIVAWAAAAAGATAWATTGAVIYAAIATGSMAWAATWAVAETAMLKKIILYGIELFKGEQYGG